MPLNNVARGALGHMRAMLDNAANASTEAAVRSLPEEQLNALREGAIDARLPLEEYIRRFHPSLLRDSIANRAQDGPMRMAGGGLVMFASRLHPGIKKDYEDAVAFGKSLSRSSDEGPGDAARHAYMAAKMAQRFGPRAARVMGALHEMLGGENRKIQDLDNFNNAFGSELPLMSDEELRDEIIGAINEGRLRTLPPGSGNLQYCRGGLVQMRRTQNGRT